MQNNVYSVIVIDYWLRMINVKKKYIILVELSIFDSDFL